jgi:hypothetical protein
MGSDLGGTLIWILIIAGIGAIIGIGLKFLSGKKK